MPDWSGPLILSVFVLSIAVSFGLGLFAWRRRGLPGARFFALAALAQAFVVGGQLLELLSPTLALKGLFDDLQWLGTMAWPLGFLFVVLDLLDRMPRRPWRVLAGLGLVPAGVLGHVFTSYVHGLHRPGSRLVEAEPFDLLTYDNTALEMVAGLYVYSLVAVALVLLVAACFRAPGLFRSQYLVIALGMTIPVAGTMASLAGVDVAGYRDFTPVTLVFSDLVIAWGLFRLRLFDIVPLARGVVVENMDDVVVVVDRHRRVVDLNPAASALFGVDSDEAVGRLDREVFPEPISMCSPGSSSRATATSNPGPCRCATGLAAAWESCSCCGT